MPDGNPPKRFEAEFYRIKLSFAATFGFVGLGMISSYFGIQDAVFLFDLAKISLGFALGSGISVGFSK